MLWQKKGVRGLKDEWVNGVEFVWSQQEFCGFWDGKCRKHGRGAAMWVKVFTQSLGWHTVHKKCEPVLGGHSLDAEIYGCSMLIEIMKKGTSTSVYVNVIPPFASA